MDKAQQLRLARARQDVADNALVGFASYFLPDRIRGRFSGDEGRKVFMHSAVFGNPVYPAKLLPLYGDAVRRARLFLIALPRYHALYDAAYDAMCERSNLASEIEQELEAEAIALEDTYRMIDREVLVDVEGECHELGLVN